MTNPVTAELIQIALEQDAQQVLDSLRAVHDKSVETRKSLEELCELALQVRDERDRLERENKELRAALEWVIDDLTWGTTERWKGDGSNSLRAVLAKYPQS